MTALLDNLPTLLPSAILWAQSQQQRILQSGRPLNAHERKVAGLVGVSEIERVRVLLIVELPQPSEPDLRAAALEAGLLGPQTDGMTFGHGIYIRAGKARDRLLSHELRHVHQYETAGSIAAFLEQYLLQIATDGYERAPFEIDARREERG